MQGAGAPPPYPCFQPPNLHAGSRTHWFQWVFVFAHTIDGPSAGLETDCPGGRGGWLWVHCLPHPPKKYTTSRHCFQCYRAGEVFDSPVLGWLCFSSMDIAHWENITTQAQEVCYQQYNELKMKLKKKMNAPTVSTNLYASIYYILLLGFKYTFKKTFLISCRAVILTITPLPRKSLTWSFIPVLGQ